MNIKIFNLLKVSCKKISQKNDFELFLIFSQIYNNFFKYINLSNCHEIAFFRRKHDCIDYYAIIDELIKKNKKVYIIEDCTNNLSISSINKITNFVSIDDGIYSYPKSKKNNLKNIDVIVYPLQLYKNSYGYIYSVNEYEFLRKYKGLKIGLCFKESLINSSLDFKQFKFIKFDKIIVV